MSARGTASNCFSSLSRGEMAEKLKKTLFSVTGTGRRSFLPAEVLRGSTGSGSEAPSAFEVKPGTTDVAVPISRRRLLTPCVDSFRRLPMPCVDSLRRWDTEEPPRVNPPLRSPLSMLMANRMEFKPEKRRSRRR